MIEKNRHNDLEDLIQTTTDDLRQQQEKANIFAAKRPSPLRGKQILALFLLAVFSGVLYYQYPQIVEPYALPDARTDPAVVEADLEVIGGLIEAYRLSKGKYPEGLDRVLLPAGVAELVARFPPEYRLSDKSFTLEWKPYRWHAVYESDTGKINVVPLKE